MISSANFCFVFDSPCTSNLHRVASFMVIVAKIESLITLGASLALFGKVQWINDIFKASLEIRKVGACALLTSGECWFAVSIFIRNQTFSNCFLLQPPRGSKRIVLAPSTASGVSRRYGVARYARRGVYNIGMIYHKDNATQWISLRHISER